ncbi:phage tail protein [Pseudomonas sp. dw_358]|uniref:phage tail protein n=1 Tax=Pseudomonas sp. dw_358 TaxID=2720083 RepID=UPI001BD4339B|nr:phage tail protein [Pseudomonas sp. dw_358]
MTYTAQLQAALSALVSAGESGRRNLDDLLGPLNGAIGDLTGAASSLEGLPGLPAGAGEKLQRTLRAINAAQTKVGTVANTYGQAARAVSQIDERLQTLREQVGRAGAAVNQMAGRVDPLLASIIPTSAFAPDSTPASEAVMPYAHLLILHPHPSDAQPYYFNLDTAAFNELRRQTDFRWALQERLTRRPAQQAVGQGDDKITLRGAIYPGFKGGLQQLDTLRSIGAALKPFDLTTGYGQVLGTWCLTRIDEEQSALLQGALPRKQSFTLEFVRYGDDLQNR